MQNIPGTVQNEKTEEVDEAAEENNNHSNLNNTNNSSKNEGKYNTEPFSNMMFTCVNMKMTAEGRYSKELKKASRVIVKIAEILRSTLVGTGKIYERVLNQIELVCYASWLSLRYFVQLGQEGVTDYYYTVLATDKPKTKESFSPD